MILTERSSCFEASKPTAASLTSSEKFVSLGQFKSSTSPFLRSSGIHHSTMLTIPSSPFHHRPTNQIPSQCLSSPPSLPSTQCLHSLQHKTPISPSPPFSPLARAKAHKSAAHAKACVTLDQCVEHPRLLSQNRDAAAQQAAMPSTRQVLWSEMPHDGEMPCMLHEGGSCVLPRAEGEGLRTFVLSRGFFSSFGEGPLEIACEKAERVRCLPLVRLHKCFFVELLAWCAGA